MKSLKNINSFFQDNKYLLAFTGIAIVYTCNLFIDIMDVDASDLAVVAQEMYKRSEFLQLFRRGEDYLDKPPMVMWTACLSYMIFGIKTFAYKLPAVLIVILGIYSTYKFCLLYYHKQIAILAALILASCQAVFLITNDIRTDGMLMGFICFSVWQTACYLKQQKLSGLILGSIGVACALMTKGPIGLVIPVFGLFADLLLKKKWKALFDVKWLLGIFIVVILLLPMCYGLYTQFDMHPEKTVYNLQSPSGLKFFFWTQSFGRITGDIYWNNHAPVYFFILSMLWDFQPWVLFFFGAIGWKAYQLIKIRFSPDANVEYISFWGFVLPFLALSLSRYKLPHYIFPLMPFAAIMTAEFMYFLSGTYKVLFRRLQLTHFGFMQLFPIILAVGFSQFFKPDPITLLVSLFGWIGAWWIFVRQNDSIQKTLFSTLAIAISFNFCLSYYFYPSILRYQSYSNAGKYINTHFPATDKLYCFEHRGGLSLDFYSRRLASDVDSTGLLNAPAGSIVVTDSQGLRKINLQFPNQFRVHDSFPDYHITTLSWRFLNKTSRPQCLQQLYVIQN